MKKQTSPAPSAPNRSILSKAVIAVLISVAFLATPAVAQQKLSLADIITVLRSKKATPDQKNQLLTEGIRQRGVTFALNPDLETELRSAGANETLVATIRAAGPQPKVEVKPEPKPEVKPEPKPAATPAPPDFTFYQNKANQSFVLGELDAAIADYGRAIELKPNESSLYFARALARLNKQDYSLAINDFDKVVELDPKEASAYGKRAAAFEKLNSLDSAAKDYEKLLELEPENENAKAGLARVRDAISRSVQPTKPNFIVVQNRPVEPPMKTPKKEDNKDAKKPKPETIADATNVGALNSFATRLSMPVYPPMMRQNRIEGVVSVEITLDEAGEIVSAKAIYGPTGLRQAAEDAVKRSKFKPVTVDGQIVRASGFINFSFKATN